ncbi:MAG: UvrD-helicase domain-containing protein [Clostridia bacterium]|nr:UvrD-helicase domain-containing protein [Clostridia bacterium]
MLDLKSLNKEQYEAATTFDGPLLVLAGAGSGKTRVLTYRIANLILNHGVPPWAILAVTFTNKAAREMKERVDNLLGTPNSDMWVTTFHSFCVRVLRGDIDKLGIERSFTIYDDQDQNSVIADIMKQMKIDEKEMSKASIRSIISEAKNSSERPEAYILEAAGPSADTFVDIYRAYQKRLAECSALDFDDLLLYAVRLFKEQPAVLEKYRRKFRYVLVDEYQDTNFPQYQIVKLLCSEHRNICVVGDDDQSIYGWRGADIRNILEFEKDFEGAKVVRLEQNYRSTKAILDCANKVIANNAGRKRKTLWTAKPGGERVELIIVENERDEAYTIAKTISWMHRSERRSYNDFAVLYRTHAQSRVIESVLTTGYGIPISIIGGTRFYSYQEIKDLLAYLKLISNPNDDVAFKRIINVPKRGIGAATISSIEMAARSKDISLFMACITPDALPEKLVKKVLPFIDLMRELFAKRYQMGLSELAENIIASTDFDAYLLELGSDKYDTRTENVQELLGAMREHEQQLPEGTDALQSFLETAALNAEADNIDESDGTVKLMTLHCAKGLEFPVVFLPGMEDGIFPSYRSKDNTSRFEEERRLCYVGVTRAEQKLFLIAARSRMLYGRQQANDPSVFLEEMELLDPNTTPMKRNSYLSSSSSRTPPVPSPRTSGGSGGFGSGAKTSYSGTNVGKDVVEQIRKMNGLNGRSSAPKPVSPAPSGAKKSAAAYKKDMRVIHPQFGKGTVVDVSSGASAAIVSIRFDNGAVRRLAAEYAPLTIIQE